MTNNTSDYVQGLKKEKEKRNNIRPSIIRMFYDKSRDERIYYLPKKIKQISQETGLSKESLEEAITNHDSRKLMGELAETNGVLIEKLLLLEKHKIPYLMDFEEIENTYKLLKEELFNPKEKENIKYAYNFFKINLK